MKKMSKLLRITFLLPGYPTIPIGGFRIVYQYANQMVMRGHSVTIIHPLRIPLLEDKDELGKTEKSVLIKRAWRKIRNYRMYLSKPSPQLWQAVDPRVNMIYHPDLPSIQAFPDADVLIATAAGTAPIVERAPLSKGSKFYLIQHFESVMGNSEEAILKTWRGQMRKIVISKWLKKLGEDNRISDISYVPNAIDHDIFNKRGKAASAEWPVSILSLWHNAAWKGARDALAAIQIVHAKYPEVKVSFFGTHKRPESLPEWIYYFHSPTQPELVEIYNAHSIYLSASKSEGLGLTPIEAMACGSCFVGTAINGFLDYAVNEKNALLSPAENPLLLAENLTRVIESPALRAQLSLQGYLDSQNFSWDHSAAAFESILLQFSQ